MYTIYGDIYSGNCYKVALALTHLNLKFTWNVMSVVDGDTQTDSFKKLNPNGKIPIMELPDGQVLTESNAILNFLAHDSIYLPNDPLVRARVLEWQFFEQYSHEPTVAVARFIVRFLGNPAEKSDTLREKHLAGYKALDVMENHLQRNNFFAGNTYTIADMSLYAYTHVAAEGNMDLHRYTSIHMWLKRVESQPGHQPMSSLAKTI